MSRGWRCCATSACRSASRENETNGQAFQDRPGEAQAEVRGAQVQPVPALRAPPRVPAQVPDVPDLPAQAGAPRRGDGAHQELLVGKYSTSAARTPVSARPGGRGRTNDEPGSALEGEGSRTKDERE